MNDPAPETTDPDVESLFFLSGGRINRGLERARLARGAQLRTGRLAALSLLVTWMPLVVLAALDGLAWGDRVEVPFLKDFLPYGQLLLAVPALILGEAFVGRLLGMASVELRRSEVLAAEDTRALDELLARAVARWRGKGVNASILFLTCASTLIYWWKAPELIADGWQYVDGRLSLSGMWYVAVSLPVMRFLALRWLWRLVMWTWLLWRVSRMKLRPHPMHPDGAGGLAFLGGAQAGFGVLAFGFAVQFSCLIADAVYYRGADMMSFRGQLLVFLAIVVVILTLPLLVFAPKMMRARGESLLFLSGSAYRGAEYLMDKLRAAKTTELPANEISALSDFGVLYENARKMRPVPLEWRHVLTLVLATLLPFLPLVFLIMPAEEVFRSLAGFLF